MERTSSPEPSPSEATSELAAATQARGSFVTSLTMPSRYSLVSGLGNAAFAYGIALGNSTWRFGTVAFIVGLALQLAAHRTAIRLFRARNGASLRGVSGFSGPRSTWMVVGLFVVALVACIVAATWLMVAERPGWSAVAAVCAVPLTVAADRMWMARYRRNP